MENFMNYDYVFLIEKEEMWARMLMEVLQDNGVPCVKHSVYGAGFVLKTGTQERLKIYVPSNYLDQASELVKELFSEKT
jgi:hypothetical protein